MNTNASVSLMCGSLLLLAALLAGCGASPAGSGYGADAGPWTQRPSRSTSTTAAETPEKQPPPVPVMVTVRGKAATGQELRLNVTKLELRYGNNRWYTVADADALAKQEPQPLRFTAKESFALIARASIPQQKYSYVRLTVAREKSVLIREKTADAVLSVENATLPIGDWTPSDAKPNLIAITLDGAKVTMKKDDAVLAAEGLAAKALAPTGGISGKLTPANPAARVDIYWGGSKLLLGSATPSSQDGSFSVANLPAGLYRVDVTAPTQRLAEPLKDQVAVEDKVVNLKPMELVAEGK